MGFRREDPSPLCFLVKFSYGDLLDYGGSLIPMLGNFTSLDSNPFKFHECQEYIILHFLSGYLDNEEKPC